MILVTVNRPHASLISVRSIFTALCAKCRPHINGSSNFTSW